MQAPAHGLPETMAKVEEKSSHLVHGQHSPRNDQALTRVGIHCLFIHQGANQPRTQKSDAQRVIGRTAVHSEAA
jgi:hypothetical protein